KPFHKRVGKQNDAFACIALMMLGSQCFKLDQKLVSKLCSFYRRFQAAAKWKPHRTFPLPARRYFARAAELKRGPARHFAGVRVSEQIGQPQPDCECYDDRDSNEREHPVRVRRGGFCYSREHGVAAGLSSRDALRDLVIPLGAASSRRSTKRRHSRRDRAA